MRNTNVKFRFNKQILIAILIAGFILSFNNTRAQLKATFKIIQQPCHENDGVIVVNIDSSATLPISILYINKSFGLYHPPINQNGGGYINNIYTYNDTIKSLGICFFMIVKDQKGNKIDFYPQMNFPFNIDTVIITPAKCPNNKGSMKITINGGSIPDSVQWFVSNYPDYTYSNVYVGTGNPMTLPHIDKNYDALVYSNGCCIYLSDSTMYIDYQSPVKFSLKTTVANCTNGTAIVNNVTGGKAPYSYLWSTGANTTQLENLSAGDFSLTVTDSLGCYRVNDFSITQLTNLNIHMNVTNPTCLQNNGSVISFASGGTSPYTYLYSNGTTGQKVCCLTGGSAISVVATDSKGCTGTGNASINSSTPITVTYSTTPSPCKVPRGSAYLKIKGGTAPYLVEWLTYPNRFGDTIYNLAPGTYKFKVTDKVGCVQYGSVVIPFQSILQGAANSVNGLCPEKTGSVYANATGNNPPFRYRWNTGDTNQLISNAPYGNYTCTITDNLGCSVIKSAFVFKNSPVKIGIKATPASCIFNNDGSLMANAYGGKPPYNYVWNNGQSGKSLNGLKAGYYSVYVTDSDGCYKEMSAKVNYDLDDDSCYYTIKGKVYLDTNRNCQLDDGETGIEHIMVHCTGIGYTFTNADGDYSFIVPTGKYIISEVVQYIYPLSKCQNNLDTVEVTASSGCVSTINFANIINPLHDVNITTTDILNPVVGKTYIQALIIQNNGTVPESNIQTGYKHDGQLDYQNTSPDLFKQLNQANQPNWYSINTGFPTLKPGEKISLLNYYYVPTDIPLSTIINFNDTVSYTFPINNWLNDYTPWDNVNSFKTTVTGSFDPNFIEVNPQGEGNEGYIYKNDSILTYIVHFQNTGSYYAENIIITDTLDKNLDMTTIRPGYSEYPYSANMSDDGILTFTFKNINLIWESANEITSRGMLAFSVKLKQGLNIETKIRNSASIYFDYNAPVATNKTMNTIDEFHTITGKLIYDNKKMSGIKNAKLNLRNNENFIIDTAVTDTTGYFAFNKVRNGIYFIEPVINVPWGGGDPADAFLIERYYIKSYKFNDNLLKNAADINLDKKINPFDALLVNRRYIGSSVSFKAGDWLYDKIYIEVKGNNVNQDIKSVCTGDVNGSYKP